MNATGTLAPPLTAAERTRLVGILGRLGSSFEGERDAAALAATRFLKDRGITWDDVIPPPACASSTSGKWGTYQGDRREPPPWPKGSTDWKSDLAFCLRHLAEMADWPANFALSISRQRKVLSPGQAAKLAEIANDLAARGFE